MLAKISLLRSRDIIYIVQSGHEGYSQFPMLQLFRVNESKGQNSLLRIASQKFEHSRKRTQRTVKFCQKQSEIWHMILKATRGKLSTAQTIPFFQA